MSWPFTFLWSAAVQLLPSLEDARAPEAPMLGAESDFVEPASSHVLVTGVTFLSMF